MEFAGFAGIVGGYEDGTFRPDNLITRAEVVTMINRMIGRAPTENDVTVFADTNGHWAKAQINAAANPASIHQRRKDRFTGDMSVSRLKFHREPSAVVIIPTPSIARRSIIAEEHRGRQTSLGVLMMRTDWQRRRESHPYVIR